MSPRAKMFRKISQHPIVSGFKPYGFQADKKVSGSIFLHYEEYESIRLCDYEKCTQQEASVFMNVSRPTLTRIYASAREKVAQAFVEGKRLIIEGGKVIFDNEWYMCETCSCFFNYHDEEGAAKECPLCGSSAIRNCENQVGELTAEVKESLRTSKCDHQRNRGMTRCGRNKKR